MRQLPTTLAVTGIVVLFAVSAALAVHVLTVPPHLRAESGGPALTRTSDQPRSHPSRPDRHAAGRASRSHHRIAAPSQTAPPPPRHAATARGAAPVEAGRTPQSTRTPRASASPSPSPSPSPSGPLPLPTLGP